MYNYTWYKQGFIYSLWYKHGFRKNMDVSKLIWAVKQEAQSLKLYAQDYTRYYCRQWIFNLTRTLSVTNRLNVALFSLTWKKSLWYCVLVIMVIFINMCCWGLKKRGPKFYTNCYKHLDSFLYYILIFSKILGLCNFEELSGFFHKNSGNH